MSPSRAVEAARDARRHLAALEAENQRLRGEVEREQSIARDTITEYEKTTEGLSTLVDSYRDRATAAEARVVELEALQVAIESNGHYCDGMVDAWADVQIAIGDGGRGTTRAGRSLALCDFGRRR